MKLREYTLFSTVAFALTMTGCAHHKTVKTAAPMAVPTAAKEQAPAKKWADLAETVPAPKTKPAQAATAAVAITPDQAQPQAAPVSADSKTTDNTASAAKTDIVTPAATTDAIPPAAKTETAQTAVKTETPGDTTPAAPVAPVAPVTESTASMSAPAEPVKPEMPVSAEKAPAAANEAPAVNATPEPAKEAPPAPTAPSASVPQAQQDETAGCPAAEKLSGQAKKAASDANFTEAYNQMKKGLDCGYASSDKFSYADASRYAVMLGKYREAIKIATDGDNKGARAFAEYFKGDLRSAAADARETLKTEPSNADAIIALGLVKADVGESDAALVILPKDGFLGSLARAYALSCGGKTYPAIDDYSIVDPALKTGEFPPVEELKTRMAKQMEPDRNEALSDFKKLEEKQNYRGQLLTLALIARMPAPLANEIHAGTEMLAFAHKQPDATKPSKKAELAAANAQVSIKEGKFEAARNLMRRAVLLAPWDAQLRHDYAIALAKNGEFSRARWQVDVYAAASGDDAAGARLKGEIAELEKQAAEEK